MTKSCASMPMKAYSQHKRHQQPEHQTPRPRIALQRNGSHAEGEGGSEQEQRLDEGRTNLELVCAGPGPPAVPLSWCRRSRRAAQRPPRRSSEISRNRRRRFRPAPYLARIVCEVQSGVAELRPSTSSIAQAPRCCSDISSWRGTGCAACAAPASADRPLRPLSPQPMRVTSRMKERAIKVTTATTANKATIHQMRHTRPKQQTAAARPMTTPQADSLGISMSR